MPINIDNLNEILALDSMQMSKSIEKLPDQILQISEDVKNVKLPISYKKFKNIVFFGMGGSALGAHCIRSVFEKDLKVPLEIINNYNVPGSVTKDTLVFIVSYSGTTEEAISAFEKTVKKKAKIVVVSSGGKLLETAKKRKIPALIFGTQNNPCGSPRMGLGYTIFGPLFILHRLGAVQSSYIRLKPLVETAKKYIELYGLKSQETSNTAKQFASNLVKGPVWFVSSSHLAGNAHIVANQLNENAKRFGGYFLIPELNHHLLEGLSFPKSDDSAFVFIESGNFDKRILKRFAVTKEILVKNQRQFLTYECNEGEPLLEAVEVLVFGSYLGFYTAMFENIDPTAIPTVDYLKAALKAE